jgi:predicted PurR-regulated permease PerM
VSAPSSRDDDIPTGQSAAVDDPERRFFRRVGAVLLLVGLGYLLWRVLSPMWHVLAWAVLLGVLLTPMNNRLAARLGGRRQLASVASMAFLVLLVLLPLGILAGEIAAQAATLHGRLPQRVPDLGGRFLFELPWFEHFLEQVSATGHLSLAKVHAWVLDGFRHVLGRLATSGGWVAHGVFGAVAEFFLVLFVLFFVLRDGPDVARATVSLLPIEEQRRERLRRHVVDATRAVFKGIGLTALVHGFLIGIGCWIAGLPAPLVLGLLAALLALVPVVGSALIWVPAVLYLFAQGDHGYALFLGIYSVALVGAVDHVLRPMLISGHAKMPMVVVFLGVLGGLAAFGFIGLFLGPIVLGLAVALFRFEVETQVAVPAR